MYRCQQDGWSRVTFADYSVPVPATANSWVLLFRLENLLYWAESRSPHLSADISDTATSVALLLARNRI